MVNQKFKEYVTETFGKIQQRKKNQKKKSKEEDDVTKTMVAKQDGNIFDDIHAKMFGDNVNEEPTTIK